MSTTTPPSPPPLPLTRTSVQAAHALIKPYIHETPLLTSHSLNTIASTPSSSSSANPTLRLHFKCENLQRIGAFKARGAFHALQRLLSTTTPEILRSNGGVTTHSSGNHAQALALAARTANIPAHIVMPSISSPAKIAATRSYGANIIFSGSTSSEREAVVSEVIAKTGAVLIPPYDHPDIILGQGTAALELQTQFQSQNPSSRTLNAIITPCGGGGLLSGTALACEGTNIKVFGAEPSFQDADDARRAFYSATGERISSVKTLTIADGLRTPVGEIPWSIIRGRKLVEGMYAVTEDQIRAALRLVYERMKLVVEPSAVVPLAVALYNEDFRAMVEREGGDEGWDLGIILTGGNVSLDTLGTLFTQ
ncbi:tryptophan synthase beta subunit-like PLP-dependent enzyme [Echria macrotheca]|uniref:Tryptophan synthase beta subunit-like PLP-dependent enzyme n=1 Tax=Echria macrotheca TaxID=438768 RepID=A0AAJ0BD10_9PEZI|nr:tryptophan synthase beta subunit-like PLP-dependent enzyme [Echria macrotheca]